MKVTYKFANGERCDIEVDERWSDELAELDRLEYNANQRESRRHCSLDSMDYEGEFFADGTDVLSDFLKRQDAERLSAAMDSLLPRQKELLQKVFYEGLSIAGIAREEGVNEAAIRGRLKKIYRQIKKF
ncbi:MAG: sigma-70 family RNA polymerase sigma factor [Clostridiales bacterium]|jgi:RNA polymerase sigma-70 factor (ECF subfamily)|nr:sigma-70 family RNA polymerase sigma factor [Clostridiales bacterium]